MGTNFHELVFDGENHENFCPAKISGYTVYKYDTRIVMSDDQIDKPT